MTILIHKLDDNKCKVHVLSRKGKILLIDIRKIKDACGNLQVNL